MSDLCANCGHSKQLHFPWCQNPYIPGKCNHEYDLCSCRDYREPEPTSATANSVGLPNPEPVESDRQSSESRGLEASTARRVEVDESWVCSWCGDEFEPGDWSSTDCCSCDPVPMSHLPSILKAARSENAEIMREWEAEVKTLTSTTASLTPPEQAGTGDDDPDTLIASTTTAEPSPESTEYVPAGEWPPGSPSRPVSTDEEEGQHV